MRSTQSHDHDSRKGAMLALIAICLPIMLIFAAYSINVAYMQMVRAELRTATDAASRAGSRKFSLSNDTAEAETAAREAARRNIVAGQPLQLAASDLEWGFSQPPVPGKRWEFRAASGLSPRLNSIRVRGARTAGSVSGSVPLLFPQFAESGVFQPVKSSTATHIDRDLCLVLDRSGSMSDGLSGRGGSTKWSDLKESVENFMAALERTPQEEQVALVTYSTFASINLNLTLDYEEVIDVMNGHSPGGMTAIGEGTARGRTAVTDPNYARKYAMKTIVVLTDGYQNRGRYPDRIARAAHEDADITVHTIAFGDAVNESLMRRTAEYGGGQYWKATTPEALSAVFTEIANNLPTLLTN